MITYSDIQDVIKSMSTINALNDNNVESSLTIYVSASNFIKLDEDLFYRLHSSENNEIFYPSNDTINIDYNRIHIQIKKRL